MKKLLVTLFTMLFLMGIATAALAATTKPAIPTEGDYQGDNNYSAPMPDGDNFDNGIGNANMTGLNVDDDSGASVNDVIKSVNMFGGTQRTHGEYQNNTNSCASCHQTHTGAAKDLLFKSGVYNTCTACHDGTLGFYNVFEASTAGTFGGTQAGNASVHMVQGNLNIAWAPGGADHMKGDGDGSEGNTWTQPFDCASCHAPHGSYSDRILHYSPNGMANTAIANGGQKVLGAPVLDAKPTANANSVDFFVYKSTAGAEAIEGEDAATPVLVLYEKLYNSSTKVYSYKRDKTPWLYGYVFDSARNKLYFSAFYDSTGKELYDVEKKYGKAYAKGAVDKAATANLGRLYVVKLGGVVTQRDGKVVNMTPIQIADFGGIPITKINVDIYDEATYGVAIGKYCGACHTDYRAKSGSETGMFSGAWRHTTDNDRYTCLKCHYAHGTDVTVMYDAQDNDVAYMTKPVVDGGLGLTEADAKAYLLDKNPSSALKRYTNMAVCWKCHTDSKAAQLKNNSYFWNNYDDVPHGGASGRLTSLEHNW